MKIKETVLSGVILIQPKIYKDTRGYFFESYNQLDFQNISFGVNFVQDNQSMSQKGVLRGLHFQNPPFAQGKLVRILHGSVLDIVVDIRKKSPTFGQHLSTILSEQNKIMLWIPAGFAHGFVTLEDNTVFFYKCTHFYNKEAEDSLLWNDTDLAINWGITNPIVSEKDNNAKLFKDLNSLF